MMKNVFLDYFYCFVNEVGSSCCVRVSPVIDICLCIAYPEKSSCTFWKDLPVERIFFQC